MFVAKAPQRINTIHGSLDSEIMTTKTVETIMKIFIRSRSSSNVRIALLDYYAKCVKKNQQRTDKGKRT
tara:strand:+ start:2053 stop:2259 length:207 start_codon:yes stop_codon:yes gene_type:complete